MGRRATDDRWIGGVIRCASPTDRIADGCGVRADCIVVDRVVELTANMASANSTIRLVKAENGRFTAVPTG